MPVLKIISGGQTGADQGGLEAGQELGLQTGGWAPRGWRTELGSQPNLAGFGLKEFPSWQYPPRTRQNIRDSDATVIFGDIWKAGSKLTANLCAKLDKPFIVIAMRGDGRQAWAEFSDWIESCSIETLNVAGNRESKYPGIQLWVRNFLVRALRK
jgi:hypothetical protein